MNKKMSVKLLAHGKQFREPTRRFERNNPRSWKNRASQPMLVRALELTARVLCIGEGQCRQGEEMLRNASTYLRCLVIERGDERDRFFRRKAIDAK